MKKIICLTASLFLFWACGTSGDDSASSSNNGEQQTDSNGKADTIMGDTTGSTTESLPMGGTANDLPVDEPVIMDEPVAGGEPSIMDDVADGTPVMSITHQLGHS